MGISDGESDRTIESEQKTCLGMAHDCCLHSQRELNDASVRGSMSSRPSGHCGSGPFEVDTGRVGRRGLPFEDGSNALANGSVRPALFPWTKQSSACGQLEGRLGTQNDSGHLAGPFILPWDPLGPPRPWRPSVAQPVVPVQKFLGLSWLCITFMPLPPFNFAFLWWEKCG